MAIEDRQRRELARRLIVALDLSTPEEALGVVDDLGTSVERYKIGSRMFTSVGPQIIDALAERGKRVFLDLKYHDIPSVVGSAVGIVARNHPAVFMCTIHASGGAAMVNAAAEAATARRGDSLQVIAVTALTSLSPAETRLLGIDMCLDDWVIKIGQLALEAGAHGLVCSANEVANVREWVGPEPTIVTPGVRLADEGVRVGEDQARIATPRASIAAGSSYLVMGRPIIQADDRRAVIDRIAATL